MNIIRFRELLNRWAYSTATISITKSLEKKSLSGGIYCEWRACILMPQGPDIGVMFVVEVTGEKLYKYPETLDPIDEVENDFRVLIGLDEGTRTTSVEWDFSTAEFSIKHRFETPHHIILAMNNIADENKKDTANG